MTQLKPSIKYRSSKYKARVTTPVKLNVKFWVMMMMMIRYLSIFYSLNIWGVKYPIFPKFSKIYVHIHARAKSTYFRLMKFKKLVHLHGTN